MATPAPAVVNYNKNVDKVWQDEIVATATTEDVWGTDTEFQVRVKVKLIKQKFHQDRFLRAIHLPTDVKKSEIRQMFADFPISSIHLSTAQDAAGTAKVYLEDPEMLDDWDKTRMFLLRDQPIPVTPNPTEMLLCVARLPLDFDEAKFDGLVRSFGEVNVCFLMISEKTGESKGYGFVEYTTRETALKAQLELQRMKFLNQPLWAEFLDSSHINFDSLHSKCLYVTNLPPNCHDMAEFRKKFSVIVNPPYCQIALKNGCPLTWGLVEFHSWEEAELTFNAVNETVFKGSKLKISYYVPGIRAINLFLKLIQESEAPKGGGLLPDPPAPAVIEAFKNLHKQNPVFAQNVKTIMYSQKLMTNVADMVEKPVGMKLNPPPIGKRTPNQSRTTSPLPNEILDSARLLNGPIMPSLTTNILEQAKVMNGVKAGDSDVLPGIVPAVIPPVGVSGETTTAKVTRPFNTSPFPTTLNPFLLPNYPFLGMPNALTGLVNPGAWPGVVENPYSNVPLMNYFDILEQSMQMHNLSPDAQTGLTAWLKAARTVAMGKENLAAPSVHFNVGSFSNNSSFNGPITTPQNQINQHQTQSTIINNVNNSPTQPYDDLSSQCSTLSSESSNLISESSLELQNVSVDSEKSLWGKSGQVYQPPNFNVPPPIGYEQTKRPQYGESSSYQTLGQKRKLTGSHRETNPDCDYFGQHTQGLPGHYIESYLKRKKV